LAPPSAADREQVPNIKSGSYAAALHSASRQSSSVMAASGGLDAPHAAAAAFQDRISFLS